MPWTEETSESGVLYVSETEKMGKPELKALLKKIHESDNQFSN